MITSDLFQLLSRVHQAVGSIVRMVHEHGAKDGSLISTCKVLLLMRAICLLKVVDAVLLFIVMAVILFQEEVTFEYRSVMSRVIRMV